MLTYYNTILVIRFRNDFNYKKKSDKIYLQNKDNIVKFKERKSQ